MEQNSICFFPRLSIIIITNLEYELNPLIDKKILNTELSIKRT